MFVVLSRFTVANGSDMAAQVKEAFKHRPHEVEAAAGFVRLDAISPVEKPAEIWLLTYWADESSFRQWYRTHQYQAVHQNIPAGLKLLSPETTMQFFDYICS